VLENASKVESGRNRGEEKNTQIEYSDTTPTWLAKLDSPEGGGKKGGDGDIKKARVTVYYHSAAALHPIGLQSEEGTKFRKISAHDEKK